MTNNPFSLFSLSSLIPVIGYLSLSACTIGAFSPFVTRENRPILWKNRDVQNPDQEVKLLSGPRFRFVANVYAGETLDVWAGINEAGFAIMNSNSYNLSCEAGKSILARTAPARYAGTSDDGNIMRLALGSCATVEDFARLLDSLNVIGRETPANYGVFDSTGTTAIFEASNTYYTRYDANLDPLRFLLRANYSLSGGPSRLLGKNRFERAMQLCSLQQQQGPISVKFIIQTLCRDLGQVGFNPYPLPFLSRLEPLPYGYLPTDTTICRHLTRSAEIMVGPQPGCSPRTTMMWILLGEPVATLPVPLWVQAGTPPEELDGDLTAKICDEAQQLCAWLYPEPEFPRAINTFRLARWLDYIAETESKLWALFERNESLFSETGPDSATAARLTQECCNLLIDAYQHFWNSVEPERTPLELKTRPKTIPTLQNSSLKLDGAWVLFDATGRKVTTPVTAGLFFLIDGEKRLRVVRLN